MAFPGFAKHAPQFFHELSIEMNRDWYEANKQRYQDEWAAPMTELLEAVRGKLAGAYRPLALGAPKLFRLHRDVRFAADKTPYKTHIAARIPLGAKKPIEGGLTALYVQFGLEEDWSGAGTYCFDAPQTARWRKRVLADATGKPLVALVTNARKAGLEVGGHGDYKRVPKGLPADHARADYLRMRGLTASFPTIPRGLLHKPALVDWLADRAAAAAPLVKWLHALG